MDSERDKRLEKGLTARSGKALLSVVIPLFNEEDNLAPLFKELEEVRLQLLDTEIEYILVDDGSSDNTFAVAKELFDRSERFKIIRLARNYGGHAAIAVGLSEASGDCAMFIAGDLQDPPSLIPEMLAKWRSGFKIVFAARTYVEQQPFSERFFSQCFWYLFNMISAYPLPARGVDFALMDRVVVDIIRSQAHLRIPVFSHLVETGFPGAIVKYVKRPRATGTSGWTMHKKFAYATHTIYTSMKTFRIIGLLVGTICLFSLIVLLRAAARAHLPWIWVIEIVGLHVVFLSIVVLVLILAEQMNLRLKGIEGTPRFIVREIVQREGPNPSV
jgi:dolichol-phosphate mannosyltransferase